MAIVKGVSDFVVCQVTYSRAMNYALWPNIAVATRRHLTIPVGRDTKQVKLVHKP